MRMLLVQLTSQKHNGSKLMLTLQKVYQKSSKITVISNWLKFRNPDLNRCFIAWLFSGDIADAKVLAELVFGNITNEYTCSFIMAAFSRNAINLNNSPYARNKSRKNHQNYWITCTIILNGSIQWSHGFYQHCRLVITPLVFRDVILGAPQGVDLSQQVFIAYTKFQTQNYLQTQAYATWTNTHWFSINI